MHASFSSYACTLHAHAPLPRLDDPPRCAPNWRHSRRHRLVLFRRAAQEVPITPRGGQALWASDADAGQGAESCGRRQQWWQQRRRWRRREHFTHHQQRWHDGSLAAFAPFDPCASSRRHRQRSSAQWRGSRADFPPRWGRSALRRLAACDCACWCPPRADASCPPSRLASATDAYLGSAAAAAATAAARVAAAVAAAAALASSFTAAISTAAASAASAAPAATAPAYVGLSDRAPSSFYAPSSSSHASSSFSASRSHFPRRRE